MTWRYAAGTLRFAANFGDEAASVSVAPGESAIWHNLPTAPAGGATLLLPPWTAAFLTGPTR